MITNTIELEHFQSSQTRFENSNQQKFEKQGRLKLVKNQQHKKKNKELLDPIDEQQNQTNRG